MSGTLAVKKVCAGQHIRRLVAPAREIQEELHCIANRAASSRAARICSASSCGYVGRISSAVSLRQAFEVSNTPEFVCREARFAHHNVGTSLDVLWELYGSNVPASHLRFSQSGPHFGLAWRPFASRNFYAHNVSMKQVGIGELKLLLSECLRAVRRGVIISILDRERPVAHIVPVRDKNALRIRKPSRPRRRPIVSSFPGHWR